MMQKNKVETFRLPKLFGESQECCGIHVVLMGSHVNVYFYVVFFLSVDLGLLKTFASC